MIDAYEVLNTRQCRLQPRSQCHVVDRVAAALALHTAQPVCKHKHTPVVKHVTSEHMTVCQSAGRANPVSSLQNSQKRAPCVHRCACWEAPTVMAICQMPGFWIWGRLAGAGCLLPTCLLQQPGTLPTCCNVMRYSFTCILVSLSFALDHSAMHTTVPLLLPAASGVLMLAQSCLCCKQHCQQSHTSHTSLPAGLHQNCMCCPFRHCCYKMFTPLCQLDTMMQVLVSPSCATCVQGQQMVVYGGESSHEADENEAGNAADAGNKVYNDLIILEPDMRLWIGLSVTGISKTLPDPGTQIPKRMLLCWRTTCCRYFQNMVIPLGGCSTIQSSHGGCIDNCA